MAPVGSEALGERALPRLSWGSVIAGVLLALAAHVVLGLLGAALGFAAQPADSNVVGAGAAIWGLLTPFVATLLGAWLACRMAGERDTAGTNVHGIMVWCIGLLAGALFLTGTLATGAMTAGTVASGNAGALRQLTGATRQDVQGPQAEVRAERAADAAGKRAAGIAGGAAMAALAGLLGAFGGAGLARRREGKGLGFKIAIQRRSEQQRHEGGYRPVEAGQSYGAARTYGERQYVGTERPYAGSGEQGESTRDVTRTEGEGAPPTSDPYHH